MGLVRMCPWIHSSKFITPSSRDPQMATSLVVRTQSVNKPSLGRTDYSPGITVSSDGVRRVLSRIFVKTVDVLLFAVGWQKLYSGVLAKMTMKVMHRIGIKHNKSATLVAGMQHHPLQQYEEIRSA